MTKRDWEIPADERNYLRDLAKKQAGIAALPVMAERKRMWYDLNDGKPGARPPVIIETWTFDRDFMPVSVYRCKSRTGRGIEHNLLTNIRCHEIINDDKVVPDTYDIGWFVHVDEFGFRVETETRPDAQGVDTAFRYIHPIKDLEQDFGKLKPATCTVDRDGTGEWKAFHEELLGDILPVRIRTGTFGATMLTNRVIELMGMEAFFEAMLETPEAVHRLMSYLRDNSLRMMKWAEGEGLLRVNNGNQDSFGSSYNFTTKLPAPGLEGEAARLKDMWGSTNSQESTGISPAMYNEFLFPYYRDAVEPVGLLYYGCCEPPHPYWKDISRYPHLKKVSVPKWCDLKFIGEALKGTGVVLSRKPDPNRLGVDVKLDEDGWRAHIREVLEAAPGVPVEFIVRDVYTVHGNLDKPRRAVELAHEEIDRHFGG